MSTQTETTPTVSSPSRTVTPKLRCIITGKERLTNQAYLTTHAQKFNGDVQAFLDNYISREALRLLRQGKDVSTVRKELNVSLNDTIDEARLAIAVKANGKWSQQ